MKKILIIIPLSLILFLFTGCYDATSIENFIYGTAIGVDLNDDGTLSLSVQILSIEGSNSFSSKLIKPEIINVNCTSLNSGLNTVNNYISKPLNLSHCEIIIFSEKVAKNGIGDLINTLANNLEIRPNSNVIVSKDSPKDILSLATEHSEEFSTRLYSSIIDSWKETGFSCNVNFSDFFASLNSNLSYPYATYIALTDNTIQLQGLAIFKRDKLIGNLNSIETLPFLLLTNKLEKSTITIPDPFNPDKKLDLEIDLYKNTQNQVSIFENTTPVINSNITLNATITSGSLDFDYSSNENIVIIEDAVNNYISTLTENTFYKLSHELDCDSINFYQYLSYQYATTSQIENLNWQNIYKNAQINVNCNSKILSSYLFLKQ